MTGEGSEEDRFGTVFSGSESFDYKGCGKILDLEKGQLMPGVEVTTSEYERILEVYPAGYLLIAKNGEFVIVNFEGKTIVPEYKSIQYVEPGYFVAEVQYGSYDVHDLSGKNQ